jgi:hypothetical protein
VHGRQLDPELRTEMQTAKAAGSCQFHTSRTVVRCDSAFAESHETGSDRPGEGVSTLAGSRPHQTSRQMEFSAV